MRTSFSVFFVLFLTSNLSWTDAVIKVRMDLKTGKKKTKDIENPGPDFFIVRFNRHKKTLSSCYKCFCVLLLDAILLSMQTSDKQLKGQ